MDLTALINRVESRLQKLDLLHDLMGREIEDARDDLSAIKAELGQAGQPELPLEPQQGKAENGKAES